MAAVPCSQELGDHVRVDVGKYVDLSGRRFERLTCLFCIGQAKDTAVFLCRCDCGRLSICRGKNLLAGVTRSCGCLQKQRTKAAVTKHGRSTDPVYKRWTAMVQRCTNPNNDSFHKYGARGIRVCERWMNFDLFVQDMGEPPPGMTLERKNNDGNYEPGNCKWATPREQAYNTRKFYGALALTRAGETKSVREWSESLGMKLGTLYWRLERGWPVERVLSTSKWGVER